MSSFWSFRSQQYTQYALTLRALEKGLLLIFSRIVLRRGYIYRIVMQICVVAHSSFHFSLLNDGCILALTMLAVSCTFYSDEYLNWQAFHFLPFAFRLSNYETVISDKIARLFYRSFYKEHISCDHATRKTVGLIPYRDISSFRFLMHFFCILLQIVL